MALPLPGRALLMAGLAAALPGAAGAEPCTPQVLMAKVGTVTELLERQMQQPARGRRAAMERMHAAMRRHEAGVADYQGVCDAYDDLIAQLRR